MHLKRGWLQWIEKRLPAGERSQVQAHLADCPACEAELAEWQGLVESLETMPGALSAVPWHKDRLWQAVRAQVRVLPAVRGLGQGFRLASAALLMVIACGLWWESVLSVSPVATFQPVYLAPPPATPPGQVMGLQKTLPVRASVLAAPDRETPQPMPAPVQTPWQAAPLGSDG